MNKRNLVAMVVIEMDADVMIGEPSAWGNELGLTVRDAVLTALPNTERVVALMAENEARLMLAAHCIAMSEAQHVTQPARLGAALRGRRLH